MALGHRKKENIDIIYDMICDKKIIDV